MASASFSTHKTKFNKDWELVERQQAQNFIERARKRANLEAERDLPTETWEAGYDPKTAIARLERMEKRNLLKAAHYAKQVLALELPDAWKADMEIEAKRHFESINKVLKDDTTMDVWLDKGLLTANELTTLKDKFSSYFFWQKTSPEERLEYIQKLFNVSQAGAGFLLQQELNKSITGKGIQMLTNTSSMMLASSVKSKQGWFLAFDAAVASGAVTSFCNLTLTFFGQQMSENGWKLEKPWQKYIKEKGVKYGQQAKDWVVKSAHFTDEKLKGFGAWAVQKLTGNQDAGGFASFFTGFLYLCCPLLMYLAAPYLALIAAGAGSLVSGFFLWLGLNAGVPIASFASNLYGEALSKVTRDVFSLQTAGSVWNLMKGHPDMAAVIGLVATILTGAGVALTGLGAFFMPTFIVKLANFAWAAASYPFEMVTGIRLSTLLFYLALGVGIPVLGTQTFVWTGLSMIVNISVTHLTRVAMMNLGLTLASQVSFVGIHYLRNGFMELLRRSLDNVNNESKKAKIYLFLKRWGSVLDALFYLVMVTGGGLYLAKDAYLNILNKAVPAYKALKPGFSAAVQVSEQIVGPIVKVAPPVVAAAQTAFTNVSALVPNVAL